ncbi:MAG: MlaA family lipoprotein [Burkholderiales bacterium]
MEFKSTTARTAGKNNNAVWLTLAALLMSGCASTPKGDDNGDPYEGVNRSIYKFNDTLDRAVIKPVATGYVKVTPEPLRNSVSNFFDNVGYFNTILNDFFQGKLKQGFADTSRFLLNSTVGALGLVDVASKVGLPPHEEDLGQTLGVYGASQGPYLVLPLLGPNTVRDSPGLAMSAVTNGLFYVSSLVITFPLGVLGVIDARARAASSLQIVDEAALDRYVFLRDAYLQHRRFLVYDGNPPPEKFDDESGEPAQTSR